MDLNNVVEPKFLKPGQNTTGSAATLTTARNIGGVSFNGSANINLPGVNAGGNQSTSGNADTATLATTITVAGETDGDTECFVLLSTAASGSLGAKTKSSLTFNAEKGSLKVSILGVGVNSSGTAGEIRASNDITAFYSSDKRLKDNIKKIENPLDKLDNINGYTFDWIEKEGIHSNKGHDIGVIAQEIEEVLPEVTTTRDNGYKAVRYEKIVPLLIECIKEQQKQIDELKKDIISLK